MITMPIQLNELNKRILTGVLGGIVFLLVILKGGQIGVTLVTAGLSLFMTYEFSGMIYVLDDKVEKKYLLLCMAWLAEFLNFIIPDAEIELLLGSLMILFFYFLVTAKKYAEVQFAEHFKELMYSLFGLAYLTFMPLYLPEIYKHPNGATWAVLFFLIIWADDTGAYFTGKKYGKRKLYAHISPNKTVEGSLGGIGASIIVALLYKVLAFRAMHWSSVVAIPLIVGVVSQVGDLCESFLKRAFNKKDSGTLLPGHGGFLDRFDGVVFSLPVMYACVKMFG